jgi:hypothetical protein
MTTAAEVMITDVTTAGKGVDDAQTELGLAAALPTATMPSTNRSSSFSPICRPIAQKRFSAPSQSISQFPCMCRMDS